MRILIFGGTGEARELANRLVTEGHDITTSLAGRTLEPLLPQGSVRIGGFGDYPRLRAYLHNESFDAIVDATHPFAEKISASLAAAAQELALPLVRLSRPGWEQPVGAIWVEVQSAEEVGNLVPQDAVVFDTRGQKAVSDLQIGWRGRRIIRLIEPADHVSSSNDTIIVDRPPYTIEGELALMREYGVTHLLTKNSGGDQTRAKIDAAVELGVTIVVISRPVLPPVAREVTSADEALAAVHEIFA